MPNYGEPTAHTPGTPMFIFGAFVCLTIVIGYAL